MSHPSASKRPIQRRISLLRHAQATADTEGNDAARPLTPAGREAAAALGDWLRERALLPQLTVCSTAKRTRETLNQLAMTMPVILSERVYLASAPELLTLIHERDDAVEHILLVGHNPGMHGLITLLAGEYVREADADALIAHFSPCSFVSMSVDAARWQDVLPQAAVLDAYRPGDQE